MGDRLQGSLSESVIIYREEPKESDLRDVHRIVESTAFFSKVEVEIAVELVRERLELGEESGYYFVFAEKSGKVIGYTCYGPISGTESSFDLYWIAVIEGLHGMGLGKRLMAMTETKIAAMGGGRVYIETSSRAQYDPTRKFYDACGYTHEATLKDFYSAGDSKAIYSKEIKK